jgi:hypothetical protein
LQTDVIELSAGVLRNNNYAGSISGNLKFITSNRDTGGADVPYSFGSVTIGASESEDFTVQFNALELIIGEVGTYETSIVFTPTSGECHNPIILRTFDLEIVEVIDSTAPDVSSVEIDEHFPI